jgi:hypothetical protein
MGECRLPEFPSKRSPASATTVGFGQYPQPRRKWGVIVRDAGSRYLLLYPCGIGGVATRYQATYRCSPLASLT